MTLVASQLLSTSSRMWYTDSGCTDASVSVGDVSLSMYDRIVTMTGGDFDLYLSQHACMYTI